MPQASFAMFKAWMKTPNVARAPSRPFSGWDEAIVETRCGREKSVWGEGCEGTRNRGWAVISPRGSQSITGPTSIRLDETLNPPATPLENVARLATHSASYARCQDSDTAIQVMDQNTHRVS